MLLRYRIVLFAFMMLAFMPTSYAMALSPAENFVKELTDKGITEVVEADVSLEEKRKRFHDLFVKAVDLPSIGRFVLGRYWRKASESDRDGFIRSFKDLTVLTWSDRFDEYSGQRLDFLGTQPAGKKGTQVFVKSRVLQSEGEPVEVIWRVKKKDNGFKIIDIVIEGASMTMTYRNEYASVLQNNGGNVAALSDLLDEKTATFTP